MTKAESIVYEIENSEENEFRSCINLIAKSIPAARRSPKSRFFETLRDKSNGSLGTDNYHVLAYKVGRALAGVGVGYYIGEINSGLVHYISVKKQFQGRGIGRNVREELIEKFKIDGIQINREPTKACLGEVEKGSEWMKYLLRQGVFFPEMEYWQPSVDGTSPAQRLEFYIQSFDGKMEQINREDLINIVRAVYSNAYDVENPLGNENFNRTLQSLGNRNAIAQKRLN